MKGLAKLSLLLLTLLLSAGFVAAQQTASGAAEASAEEGEPADKYEEVLVVTASRTEQHLHEAPVAISVISADEIDIAPVDDYGDLLRNVPGFNVAQISARDIQINGRKPTQSLASDQIVMLDGRTIYLDFFGFVMWDFLPVNPREIKQIEAVRGPGSAVWGANAMSGVVNLITKSPKEMAGTDVILGGGDLGTAYGSITHAGVSGRLGYKLSAGYYEQDPYERPTGFVPGTSTPYPPFENQGTQQPKLDVRFDYDSTPETTWTISAGHAGTDGIMHSGIGPFDIDDSSEMQYAKIGWSKRAMQVTLFGNFLDGQAANLLSRGLDGQPLDLGFKSDTLNLDFSNTSVVGSNHIFTYGANYRSNEFDLTIAPDGDNRDEAGVFLQDEVLIGDKVRWLVGARWDDIDPIGSVVSPRTSLLVSPKPNHTIRLSYNQAYRAPSLIENYLEIAIVNQVLLPPVPPLIPQPIPFVFPSLALGNPELQEEELEALEIGYTGTFGGRSSLSISVYRNELTNGTDFFTAGYYDSFNPPPGWPLPPFIPSPIGPIPTVPPNTFPAAFSYRNIGETVNEGVEVAYDVRPTRAWRFFVNYSYQSDPEVTGIPKEETNTPPENRLNLGLSWDGGRFFFNTLVNYQDEAFWTDVLDDRFWGPTDAFTQVNLGIGLRMAGERVVLSVIGNNIFDEEIQQHVFGDIISRKVVGQVRFTF